MSLGFEEFSVSSFEQKKYDLREQPDWTPHKKARFDLAATIEKQKLWRTNLLETLQSVYEQQQQSTLTPNGISWLALHSFVDQVSLLPNVNSIHLVVRTTNSTTYGH